MNDNWKEILTEALRKARHLADIDGLDLSSTDGICSFEDGVAVGLHRAIDLLEAEDLDNPNNHN